MNSLRLRLILLLAASLGLAWATVAWLTHREARHEVDKLFDAQLAQSAQVLLGTTRHELHERFERGDTEISVTHEYEQRLTFQIWDANGLLMRSTDAPDRALANDAPGFSETTLNNQKWRVFSRWDNHHEFMIQVAEPLEARDRLAHHISLKMLLPGLLVPPLLALVIWFAVGAGLKPLKQMRQEVMQRAADRLGPVRSDGVPDEVLPLAEALNDLFARLQQAFESERRFTADAAHELRTPLAALKTQAQVALKSEEAAERQAALENVLLGVDRATHLLAQLLTLARVDPENAAGNHELVDLRRESASVLADLANDAYAKNIDLALEEGPPVSVMGNAAQIGVLLRNLLDNAIRYTPTGGSVSVIVHDHVLEVRDSGPGIPENQREQVLQRFYRIPGSNEQGSGLGLSIVRRIVELHQARLELESGSNGKGLTVKVIFR